MNISADDIGADFCKVPVHSEQQMSIIIITDIRDEIMLFR